MRTTYKRPRIEQMHSDLNLVQESLIADKFIFFDLIWYSIIFTLLVSSPLQTVTVSIMTFAIIYATSSSAYLLISFFLKRKSSSIK
ncbi:hypothetical protein SAMN04488577_0195 [Bacillus sp. cl95]|uniref:hypothetical protein n=1 Tax=Bacillus sp. UNCCL13 TaxID=1502772 RepID=UPI0008EF6194|nr:hypothetical protein [Bacillus sp. UNCCL13]SFB25893.1 hypothetical protein SAMN02799634_11531 [Bacillus sp. UNCCL13]SFQ91861.1 hypothetical protein SAMN04488577_0195 [Bacillus sp. cl95]